MKRIVLVFAALAALLPSCQHKDLCVDHREHAHKYHIEITADYRCDWEENFGFHDWKNNWPEGYMAYDDLRPSRPSGLRVVNTSSQGQTNTHNIKAEGGIVNLYEGNNDILFYNNDTEYIIFSRTDHGASTRALTRTKTRSTYTRSEYSEEDEDTMTPPDMLFANYIEGVYAERTLEPAPLDITLQPLVYTYVVRYEFAEGLEYVALARGALTGMAKSVLLSTGETSDDGATLLYDCAIENYGISALVTSFGIPGFPNPYYPTKGPERKHALNLELMLKNGKIFSLDYDVTEQVEKQPHGGVIVVKDITIKYEDGAQNNGAFDVKVDDWGEYEDVLLPLI